MSERDLDYGPLEPGAFYWALPVLDADYDEEDKNWWNTDQPALFKGWDEKGEQIWFWIKTEGSFPARWVGKRIDP